MIHVDKKHCFYEAESDLLSLDYVKIDNTMFSTITGLSLKTTSIISDSFDGSELTRPSHESIIVPHHRSMVMPDVYSR